MFLQVFLKKACKPQSPGAIDEAKLKWSVEQVSFGNLRSKEDENGFREKRGGSHFFRKGMVGGWATYDPNENRQCVDEEEVGCSELNSEINFGWKNVFNCSRYFLSLK